MPIRNDGKDGETRYRHRPVAQMLTKPPTLAKKRGKIERKANGAFTKEGAKEAASRKRRVTKWKPPVDIGTETDEVWDACIQRAFGWFRARKDEHKKMFGHLSAGVSAILNEAKLSLATREYYLELAFREPKGRHYLTQSSKASDAFMKQMLAAWELAARESRVLKAVEAKGTRKSLKAKFGVDVETKGKDEG